MNTASYGFGFFFLLILDVILRFKTHTSSVVRNLNLTITFLSLGPYINSITLYTLHDKYYSKRIRTQATFKNFFFAKKKNENHDKTKKTRRVQPSRPTFTLSSAGETVSYYYPKTVLSVLDDRGGAGCRAADGEDEFARVSRPHHRRRYQSRTWRSARS